MQKAVISGEWELTKEQQEEFDTDDLKSFAKAFLRFQHSSPCTAKRKLFRYFEPLKEDELTDDAVIYGVDREEAYKDLISKFELCKFKNEFDKFFINKNLYWQSTTIPKIVIMKKWL